MVRRFIALIYIDLRYIKIHPRKRMDLKFFIIYLYYIENDLHKIDNYQTYIVTASGFLRHLT